MAEALRPIAAAMLQANMSASALVQAAKHAYLRAAIDSLDAEGKKPNVSRLSVVTGMTRKEIASYLPRKVTTAPRFSTKRQMEHRALRVLRAWTTDPRYRSTTGRTIALPIEGEGKTFASLVRSYGGDVTPVAVLRELERLQAVAWTHSGWLRVKSSNVQTQLKGLTRFRDFGRLLADFSGTAAQMLAVRERPLYFGFKDLEVGSDSQAARFKDAFGKRASLLLDSVEHWSARQKENANSSQRNAKWPKRRVGVGVYLVEGATDSRVRFVRKK